MHNPITRRTLCALLTSVMQLFAAYTGPVEIKGKIVNEDGEPVAATIIVKGTSISAVANMNGEFVLTGIDEQAILMINSTGIEPREVRLNGRTEVVVTVRSRVNRIPLFLQLIH